MHLECIYYPIIVSVLLHNLIYGLFIFLFGQDFWINIGLNDEPVFFFIAISILIVVGFAIAIIIGVIDIATDTILPEVEGIGTVEGNRSRY